MGFKEKKHTADWALLVWGKDLESIFVEAVRGMNSLLAPVLEPSPLETRECSLTGTDNESLLVAFLNELIYFLEQEKLVFDSIDLQITPGRLDAQMQGKRVLNAEKLIKAVTFHNLEIEQTPKGYQVEIVFDV